MKKIALALALAVLSIGAVGCKGSVAPMVATCSIDPVASTMSCNLDNLAVVGPVAVPAELSDLVALLDPSASFSCSLNVNAKTGVCTNPLTGLPTKTFKL